MKKERLRKAFGITLISFASAILGGMITVNEEIGTFATILVIGFIF